MVVIAGLLIAPLQTKNWLAQDASFGRAGCIAREGCEEFHRFGQESATSGLVSAKAGTATIIPAADTPPRIVPEQ